MDEQADIGVCSLHMPFFFIVVGYYGFMLDVRVSVSPSVFGFRMIMSKRHWIFTKLGMCIDIVEIWFGIANGQISSNFYGVVCPYLPIFLFQDNNLRK